MTLLRFDEVSLELGGQPLLVNAELAIEPGERICLLGRNGAGKTTLLKLISGELSPDRGDIVRKTGLRISQLAQTLPTALDASVQEYVASGLADVQALCDAYTQRSTQSQDAQALKELEVLQQRIEARDGWHIDRQVEAVLSELKLPAARKLNELSGGWQRRVALGKALVSRPDLLLLDEPTNHLDLSAIRWLEQRVRGFAGSVLFITHDRAYLKTLATRIVELDRGRLTAWPGSYTNFLDKKDKALEEEARHNALFDKKLAKEEAWIREGIKARRTRNEGRVRALMAMREAHAQRLTPESKARISIDTAERSGRKVIEARNIVHGYDGSTLIDGFSTKVLRGDRIGIIGNNGVGKSTLLGILLGELEPQRGSVKLGTGLEVAYFDQRRTKLDPEKTVAENVGDGREYVKVNGKDRHIVGYLGGFLFSTKRAMTPVKALSGGERNRLILAKLFTRPSNLLVLDEPTNDLDIETLEVLEERLTQYDGTLIVVSHDRVFLDNVVTSTLVFEDDGVIREYAGGYSDWLRRGRWLAEVDDPAVRKREPKRDTRSTRRAARPKKLSYKLQRELDELPVVIEQLEKAVGELREKTAASDFYVQAYPQVQAMLDELSNKECELEQYIERWAELEALQQSLSETP